MGALAKKIEAHRAALGTRSLHIPEIDTTIHVSPLTIPQRTEIYKLLKTDDLAGFIEAIFLCSHDGQGNKLFDLQDKKAMQYSGESGWIIRVGSWILEPFAAPITAADMGE